MKRLGLALFFLFLCGTRAHGACSGSSPNLTAASANSADIIACVTVAVNGDTITVPAGTVAFASVVDIPASKCITVNGQGLVTDTATSKGFSLEPSTTCESRITGFNFTGATADQANALIHVTLSAGDSCARIDHNTFSDAGGTTFIYVIGAAEVPLLIDHNTFTATSSSAEMLHILGENFGANNAWKNNVVPGSASMVFLENNVFNGVSGSASCFQGYSGSVIVARYNTFNTCAVDEHGTAGFEGVRWYEFYHNIHNNAGTNQCCYFDVRAGSGVIFSETVQGNGTGAQNLQIREEDTGTWPLAYQVGSGINGYTNGHNSCPGPLNSAPLYLWAIDSHMNIETPTPTYTLLNRDYFVSGSQPASMHWQEQTGDTCSTTYVYTPYTYPHPLDSSTPTASLSPTSLSFGNQTTGTTSSAKTITLSNGGSATLSISGITITGANPTDFGPSNNCGSAVLAGGSCTISLTFTPASAASFSASVSVADNAAGSPQTATLSGTGVSATAGTSFSPTSVAFGSQVILTSSAATPVTLTNTGSGTLTVSGVAITGTNNTDFSQTNTCGSVAPSLTCTINVTFRPTATGARSANISVTDNAAGSPQTVPLTGTGTAAAVSLAPTSLAFGNQTTGTPSAGQSVTLTNTGSATLTISSISVTGTNSGDFGQTNNCASSVLVGGSCTITAKFTPSAGGSRSASISIADSAVGSPQTVPMTGTGISTAPAVTFSQPGGLGFGNVVLNNPVLVVQHIKNTGNATLTISSMTVGGTNASMFTTHTTCGASLAAGFSCEISVVFIPTSTGAKSATVSVADNAANSPQVFSLTGTGITGTAPTLDQYGGVIATPCATVTGRFHVEQVGSQWTYCTPLGNEFYLLGVYIVDYGGSAGYTSKITAKYGSPTAWAVPTLQRIQSWGFNSPYYTSSALVRPFATDPSYPLDANGLRSIPIKMPFELKLAPGLYGMRNPVFNPTSQFPTGQMLPIGSTVKNMAAGWTPVYYVPGNFVPPTGEADYYDPNLTTFSNNFLSSQETGPTTSPYSDFVIGVAYDDGDQVFGFGAGPDFTTTPPGHNNPNLGWLTATMSPTQVVSSLYPAVYTNTQVYTKAAWQTYLVGKYGTIGALNTAWGSTYTTFGSSGTNFTGEAVGTGNGSTTTFTHTLAHLTPTPFTVQVLVNGVVIGGDLGHGSTGTLFGCSPAVTPVTTMSGTLVYSIGALSVTFVTPPPTGATITVNYQQNGWQVGTGLMDEDGRTAHQAWLSGNAFTLAGANANTVTDLNTFFFQMASTYLGIGHTALAAALPGYLFLGPDSLGSWQAPPARQVLQAVPGNVDVYTGPMQQSGTPNYQAKLDFVETWAGNIPQQNGSYLHANPDSPYASNPVAGDYTTQFLKGQAYANLFVSTKAATYTANSVHPFISLNHFDFLDISSEQTNWGLVTLLDNSYNGVESVTGSVTCSAPLQAYTCGGEAGNYGDYTDCVTQANFTGTVCSGGGTPTVSLSTTSLSFANQIIGTASNPQIVIVTNTGTGALNISSVAITGANTGDFGQNNTCSLPVGPSASCTISVVFTPTAPGSRSASVTITDNASGSPHSVTLSGTGIAGPVIGPNPAMFSLLEP